jgi:outer membrane protein OmpA-like peptidoglycan-associated protein
MNNIEKKPGFLKRSTKKINWLMKNILRNGYVIVLAISILSFYRAHAQQDSTLLKIYFPEGKYTLSPAAKATLSNFALQPRTQQAVNISGRGDRSGSDVLNDSLSLKRALAVKDFLLLNGFPRQNIHAIIGYGRRNPVETTSPFTDSLNRVVWITISSPPKEDQAPRSLVYTQRDSLIKVFAPYPVEFLAENPSPKPGDVLRIVQSIQQRGDTVLTTRVMYLAWGEKEGRQVRAVTTLDSIIRLSPPFPTAFLTLRQRPLHGDTLRIDTSLRQNEDRLLILRTIYLAEIQPSFNAIGLKEIPEKTSNKDMVQAFLDTLQNTAPGQAIVIRDLNFEFGYHVMPQSNLPALEALLAAFQRHPRLKMDIRGHVCCVEEGQDAFDKQSGQYDLSSKRAQEVYDFLIDRGVAESRLSFTGERMNRPLVYPEKNKNDQYRNRRIEFVILEK